MSKINYIERKIKSYDIVSFDIFDTLIKRDVPYPSDVFDLVYSKFSGEKLQKNSKFKFIREAAERSARVKLPKKDVNLYDIYNFMPSDINDRDKIMLSNIEQDIELSICKKNIDIVDVYNFAKINGKKIIITTDMYLPLHVIGNILQKNGFTSYDNIFLSNALNASKADGSIFDLLKKKYPNKKIIHIGDNIKSDVINARKHGISSLYWKKENNKLSYNDKGYISNFINNRIIKNNNYYYNFGYQCMGPLLFTFSKWINKSVKKDGLHDLFFLARDGKIMKRAYDLLFNDDNDIKTHYLLASRQSYIVPTIHKYKNVEALFSKMFTSNFISLRYLMKKMNISEKEIDKDLLRDVDIDQIYDNLNHILEDNNAKKFLDYVFRIASTKSIEDDYKLKQYLHENSFYGNVGIVDIGWFGNMQNALIKISDNDKINGYYLGVNSKSPYKDSQNMHGFLFNSEQNYTNEIYVRTFAGVLELLFTRYDVGSFKGFSRNKKNLIPVYGENKYSNEFSQEALKTIQDAAINFINDFKNSYLYNVIDIDMTEGFKRLKGFAISPSHKDVVMFNKIHKNDEKHLEFIDKRSAIKYIAHPKEFSDDLQSSWFAAYIYNTFKIKLPIAEMYKYFKTRG